MLVACSPQAPAQNTPIDERAQKGLQQIPLTITSGKTVHKFAVEIAASPDEQERGLMFRREIPSSTGA